MKIAICDDHNNICSQVEAFAAQACESVGVKHNIDVYYCGEALCGKLTDGEVYDLIFLDIELNAINGVDVGNTIRDIHCNEYTQIAFISGKTEYAMQLFKLHPIDFLVKPLKYADIEQIVAKVLRINRINSGVFLFEYKRETHRVQINDIIYLESSKRKVNVVTHNGTFTFYGKLESVYESQLKNRNFLFIHKSYLVNYNHVKTFGYEHLYVSNGTRLPISRARGAEIRDLQIKFEGKK